MTGSQTLPVFTPSQCTQCTQCTLGSTQQCYAPFGAEPPIVECHQSVTRSSQADASRLKAVFGIKFKHSKASDLGKLKIICRWSFGCWSWIVSKKSVILHCTAIWYCKEERCKALCQISSRQSNPTWGLESLFRESLLPNPIRSVWYQLVWLLSDTLTSSLNQSAPRTNKDVMKVWKVCWHTDSLSNT